MVEKLIIGIVASTAVVIFPVIGNIRILHAPQLWILLLVGILASVFQPRYSPFKRSSGVNDKGTALQIIWSIYVTQVMAIIECAYLRYPNSMEWNMTTTLALPVVLFGLFVRTWSVLTLRDYFTWHIAANPNQAVIREGPYGYIRHPGYAGAFITYVFIPVFLHSWYSFLASIIILSIAFSRRIHHEEHTLKKELGGEYEDYCKEVKKIIPGVW